VKPTLTLMKRQGSRTLSFNHLFLFSYFSLLSLLDLLPLHLSFSTSLSLLLFLYLSFSPSHSLPLFLYTFGGSEGEVGKVIPVRVGLRIGSS
jgi:hypothetical protein